MAAAIEDSGIGASGSAAYTALAAAAFSLPADGVAAPSAETLNADIRKTTKAAVAINLALNLIVASRTACRDQKKIPAPA
jgi:hypothetical protein